MQCPSCGLFSPPSALTCDCGYDFASGQLPQTQRRRESRRSSELTAFLIVPLIATMAWYVVMLCTLAVVNGRLRWRTDVMAMAIGAVIVGLPIAIGITIVLVLPVYAVVRSTTGITFARAALGGGLVGLCVALAFGTWTHESTVLSPLRAVLIGVATAVAWWYVAGRPSHVSDTAV
jgi:hypothetical protein